MVLSNQKRERELYASMYIYVFEQSFSLVSTNLFSYTIANLKTSGYYQNHIQNANANERERKKIVKLKVERQA